MMRRTFFLSFAALVFMSTAGRCQNLAAVPFLTIPNSVEGNGMGGIAASLITDDAISDISNPAQLGFFSMDNHVSLSTYSPRTDVPFSGASLDVTAFSAGLRLNRYMSLPIPVSLGIGYSNTYYDLGNFTETLPTSPTVISSWNAYEKADMLTLGVGFNYVVRLGLGYSYESINSHLGPFGTVGGATGSGMAKEPASDFGAILQIPVVDVISHFRKTPLAINRNVSPLLDLTFGWAERNIGRYLYYPAQQQSDPLPRQGVLGWNLEIGLKSEVNHHPWKIISIEWAREAEAALVSMKTSTTVPALGDTVYTNAFSYKGGLGSIRPIDNLLLGKMSGGISLQKGWQIQFAQCLYFREGSNIIAGEPIYKTEGESFHLDGFLKLLELFKIWQPQEGWITYIINHFDLQYNTSSYTSSQNGAWNGTDFSSVNIVFK